MQPIEFNNQSNEVEFIQAPDFSKAEVLNDQFFWGFIVSLFDNLIAQTVIKKSTQDSLKNLN